MLDKRLILLVEDDPSIRFTIETALEMEGYSLVSACNGKEALELLEGMQSELPKLILLDWMMPVMDGNEFLRRKTTLPRIANIPVAVFSALSDHEQSAIPSVSQLIRKPVRIESLLKTVEGYFIHS